MQSVKWPVIFDFMSVFVCGLFSFAASLMNVGPAW